MEGAIRSSLLVAMLRRVFTVPRFFLTDFLGIWLPFFLAPTGPFPQAQARVPVFEKLNGPRVRSEGRYDSILLERWNEMPAESYLSKWRYER